jgi:hypothetical protein
VDDGRFSAFKAERENLSRTNVLAFPATVQAAYEAAYTWRIPSELSSVTSGTAFTVVQSKKKKKKNKKDSSKAGDPGSTTPSTNVAVPQALTATSQSSDSKSSKKERKVPICDVCNNGSAHWYGECPIINECRKKTSSTKTVLVTIARATLSANGDVIKSAVVGEPIPMYETFVSETALVASSSKSTVMLDNQASISVFKNVELLTNVHPAPFRCEVSGINANASIVATEIGEYNGWKNIYACPDASSNLISFAATKDYCQNYYDAKRDIFVSIPPNRDPVEFVFRDGHYVYDVPTARSTFVVDTFTTKQIEAAEKAKSLSKALGYPSPQ